MCVCVCMCVCGSYIVDSMQCLVECRMSYGGQFGGVVTIRPQMFQRLNGFPITFFGWGGEDDAMGSRCAATEFHIQFTVVANK